MNKKLICLLLITPVLLLSFSADAKEKKRRKLRKWSVAASNGYTFHQKRSSMSEGELIAYDGQMKSYFSALEVARNFGRYEVGSRIQFYEEAFVSPFIKVNFIKNYKRKSFVPFMILGVSPSSLAGIYARLGLSLFFKRYFSFSPFLGAYAWFNLREVPNYRKYNFHLHGGLSLAIHL